MTFWQTVTADELPRARRHLSVAATMNDGAEVATTPTPPHAVTRGPGPAIWSVDPSTDLRPELSARTTFVPRQLRLLQVAAAVTLVGFVLSVRWTAVALVAVCTSLYLATLIHRLILVRAALRRPAMIHISDEDARALPADSLPVYTVLVPAYGEPDVVADLLASLAQLEYPTDKLDIKLLLEQDDLATQEAARTAGIPRHIQVVLVPPGEPRTKPRACNYGLASARGQVVTIYDAEDKPDPLQLRRAVAGFWRAGRHTACLQARLSYHNVDQNMLTRWFTGEYDMWFKYLLPGLVATGAPLPLGGTSNHIRIEALLAAGAWDPYNVTEDADLGMRLTREGYSVEVLESVTLEEANSDFVNWVKQRSRWYKGYLQTLLVHTRDVEDMRAHVGRKGVAGFLLFVGGTPIQALLNPLFWTLGVLWITGKPGWIASLFPPIVYHAALVSALLGNAVTMYLMMICNRESGRHELVVTSLLLPGYWVMMSIAAIKALVQLISAPAFWEKTAHGLDRSRVDADPTPVSTA